MRPRAGAPTSEIPDGNRDCPARGFRKGRHFPPYSGRDAGCSGLRLFRLQIFFVCKYPFPQNLCYNIGGPDKGRALPCKGGTDSGRGGGGSLLWRKSMSSPFPGTRRAGGTVERRYRAALLCPFLCRNSRKTDDFLHAFLSAEEFLISAC